MIKLEEFLNQNKWVITLTGDEYKSIDEMSKIYCKLIGATEIYIVQLLNSAGLLSDEFESKNSTINDLFPPFTRYVTEHLFKIELVFQRLEKDSSKISLESWSILGEELQTFPEKFKKSVQEFKAQLQLETNEFDKDLEEIVVNTKAICSLAKDIYALLYMNELQLKKNRLKQKYK